MINELITRYPVLDSIKSDIESAKEALIECYNNGGKVLLCGNGGSCSDCDHIVGELMKGFLSKRKLSDEKKTAIKSKCDSVEDNVLDKLQQGLPAISLPSITGLNSAFCNDVDPELMYAQSVLALAKQGDVLVALSTSGNSKNVLAAAKIAKGLGIKVISLTGCTGGMLKQFSDVCICAPEKETFKIQELHLPIYHYLCAEIESYFFG